MTEPEYGDAWVYEGIVGAVPGLDLDARTALVVQFVLFESAVLALAWVYELRWAAIAGTVAVLVTTAGSALMVSIARHVRRERTPDAYRRLLFGSNVEVVLTVFSFIGLVTYLFVVGTGTAAVTFLDGTGKEPLLETLLGSEPPAPSVFLLLLVTWDVCYRISAAWWSGVVALWRSVRFRFDDDTRRGLRRVDVETAAFGVLQLAFVPFLFDQPLLLALLVAHVGAVVMVTTLAVALLRPPAEKSSASQSD